MTVLNTFANTCTAGVAASAAGASAVCNVDVSGSCLKDGAENALRNDVQMETLKYDAIVAMRMFSGLAVKQDRRSRTTPHQHRGGEASGRRPSNQAQGL